MWFSPTYEAIILEICPVERRSPRPEVGVPALLETTVRAWMSGRWERAVMSVVGMPERPKPPQRRVDEGRREVSAAEALGRVLLVWRRGVVERRRRWSWVGGTFVEVRERVRRVVRRRMVGGAMAGGCGDLRGEGKGRVVIWGAEEVRLLSKWGRLGSRRFPLRCKIVNLI